MTTILIGTNLMHITVAGLVTYILKERLHFDREWVIILVLSFLIIVFAETIPKDWFRHKADDFIYRFAHILNFVDRALSPVSNFLIRFTDYLLQVTSSKTKRSPYVTRDEFRYVIEESAKKGVLHDHEKELINVILNLGSMRVEEVMTPVSKFPKLPLIGKIQDIKEIARKTQTPAVLIYEEIPSIVVGIVYVFDVLFEDNELQSLAKFLKAPLFMAHDTTVEKAIFLLQSRHASFGAVINDDFGSLDFKFLIGVQTSAG